MDFSFINIMKQNTWHIPALIIVSAVVTILINIFGLLNGITNILPHLLYIPIILVAYYYPRQGIATAIGISAFYCAAVYLLQNADPMALPFAIELGCTFVIVGGVVSYLSEQLHHEADMCRRLGSIVSCSNDAIIGTTLDGIITDWNDGAEKLFGYTAGEITGRPVAVIAPPARVDEGQRLVEKIRKGKVIERYETERVTKDGRVLQVSLSISPIKDNTDKVIGASVIAHDITERIYFQNEILIAKSEWERTFNAVPDMIAIIDNNYRILRVNKSMADRYGIKPDEATGRLCYELIHHSDAPPGTCPHTETIRDGKSRKQIIHDTILKADFLVTVSAIRDASGGLTKSVHVMRDITDLNRATKALADSEARYRSIVETTPNIIWEIDPEGKFVYLSPQSETILGYSPREMMNRSFYDILPQENLAGIREAMSRHGREAGMYMLEIETRNKRTNAPINLEIISQPVYAEDDTLTGYRGIAVDITDRRLAQKEIAERQRFLQRLIETISNPIFYKDRNGKYTGCNSAFEQYIGLPTEQLIGKSVYDISPKDLADVYHAKDKELLDNPGIQSYESQVRYADGIRHDVIFNTATLFDADDHVDGIVGVIVDITERKQMEDKIRVANDKLNMLASITRHDILNKLSGLLSFITLSKEATQDPELLGFIAKEEDAAAAIAIQIDFTRYYQEIGVHAPEWQNVEKTIRSSVTELPLRGITLDIVLGGLEIFADPLLGRVFYNLCENSLRHGGHVTTIAFTVEDTVRGMVLVYRDNGVGISAKEKERLFSKGFGRHTGLGLFLSREILTITGLSITETGEPGKGVRFEILLPPGTCRFPKGN
jgi:PAS domain S-box-containing protein